MSFQYPEKFYNNQSADLIVPEIFKILTPESVLDVGCGIGNWLEVFSKNGIQDYLGIDADYVDMSELLIPKEKFKSYDLSKTFKLDRKFDLICSLEVAEHLPEEAADNFVDSLVHHGDIILFSAAIPGQGGNGHINEQYPSYWQKKFKKHGYIFYDILRPKIWNNEKIGYWYRQNMFLIAKQNNMNFKGYQESDWIDMVHPEMFAYTVYHTERIRKLEEGEVGIGIALKSFRKAIINKIFKSSKNA